MAEYESQRLQEEAHQAPAREARSCPDCQAVLAPDDVFCGECGAAIASEPTPCPLCNETVIGLFCASCGANRNGVTCPDCGTVGHMDFCAVCGHALSDLAREMQNSTVFSAPPEEMTDTQAEQIKAVLSSALSEDSRKMQEKMRQRIILLKERKYFQERELRIEEFQKRGRKIVQHISPEETAWILKAAKSLSGYVEREKIRREEIRRVEEIKEQEALKAEQERIRHEQLARHAARVEGLWITSSGRIYGVMRLTRSGSGVQGQIHLQEEPGLERVDSLVGTWNGDQVVVRTTSMRTIRKPAFWQNVRIIFNGRVNDDGEILNGYIDSNQYWQEIFVKQ